MLSMMPKRSYAKHTKAGVLQSFLKGLGRMWSCPHFTDTLLLLQNESEMSKPKPVYSSQYRQQLVELVLAGHGAKEFGLHATMIAKWVRLERMGTPSAKPSSGPLNANE